MSIFTFMGSGILRLDNIYSFNVIIEVVRKLLPALLEVKSIYEKLSRTTFVRSDLYLHIFA